MKNCDYWLKHLEMLKKEEAADESSGIYRMQTQLDEPKKK